jgi:hypothetical protein
VRSSYRVIMVRMDGSLGLDGSFVNYVIILCCCGAIVYEVRMILVGWTTYWCGPLTGGTR